MVKEFCLEEYLGKALTSNDNSNEESRFKGVCTVVEKELDKDWDDTDDEVKNLRLEREKRAIMGYEAETCFYKERIKEILINNRFNDSPYPSWYPNLHEAVFAELYGLAGLAPWAYDMREEYKKSSSAKLIGDRLYCLIDGRTQLQPQRIPEKRRQQLKRTLLLATPKERLEYGFHEVYLRNGIRITLYSGDRTKEGQDIMVFRKYVMEELTFDNLAEMGTIPEYAKELFETMVKIGFNVIFAGQVRSGKTTFMQVWQKCEDASLEGLAIATDPETPWHVIMPEAPIMQLIADGKQLENITKSLLRGDNDYVLLEEMRDAAAFNLALDITSTGTQRSKATVHDNDGINIPYKMAAKIWERYGGDIKSIERQVYKNFDYVIELCQMNEDKGKKVMKGIVEYSYDCENNTIRVRRICRYDVKTRCWYWQSGITQGNRAKFPEQENNLEKMSGILKELECRFPLRRKEEYEYD